MVEACSQHAETSHYIATPNDCLRGMLSWRQRSAERVVVVRKELWRRWSHLYANVLAFRLINAPLFFKVHYVPQFTFCPLWCLRLSDWLSEKIRGEKLSACCRFEDLGLEAPKFCEREREMCVNSRYNDGLIITTYKSVNAITTDSFKSCGFHQL